MGIEMCNRPKHSVIATHFITAGTSFIEGKNNGDYGLQTTHILTAVSVEDLLPIWFST